MTKKKSEVEKEAKKANKESAIMATILNLENCERQLHIGAAALFSIAIHFMDLLAGPSLLRGDNVLENLLKLFSFELNEKHHLVVVRGQQLVGMAKNPEIGDSWWVTITMLLRVMGFKKVKGDVMTVLPLVLRNGGVLVELSDVFWYRARKGHDANRGNVLAIVEFLKGLEENDRERFERMKDVILDTRTTEIFQVNGLRVQIDPVKNVTEEYFIREEERYERMIREQIKSLEGRLEELKKS